MAIIDESFIGALPDKSEERAEPAVAIARQRRLNRSAGR